MKPNHKLAILIGVIALFVIILLGRRAQTSFKNDTVTSAIAENLVTLTDKGFSPSEITIQAGQAVRWKNTTPVLASVNSDDYPTNRLYPELNLGRFERNQTLVHVFTKPGKYTYHNQMLPQNTGIVIVQ